MDGSTNGSLVDLDIDLERPAEPKDPKPHLAVYNRVLKAFAAGVPLDSAFAPSEISPWVAYRLGCLANSVAQRDYTRAVGIAELSIQAAQLCGDSTRVAANAIGLGVIHLH